MMRDRSFPTRRSFLKAMVATAMWQATQSVSGVLADDVPRRHLVRVIPFAQEDDIPTDQRIGTGLDARLFTDLSRLTPDTLITESVRFYIRTMTPDRLKRPPVWHIQVHGQVEQELQIDAAALDRDRIDCGTHVMECSGNYRRGHFGLLSCARWEGVPLLTVLETARPRTKRILVSGFDEHSQPSELSTAGASWVFTRDQVAACRGFLATRMNGAPLASDHGAPVRLLMPNWYGCTCIKWVNEIELVDDDAPATSQMIEFAGRTHQIGEPALARDYQPATIDLAAMPIRVEQWSVDGGTVYRVVGIQWGAGAPSDKLVIRFAPKDPYVPLNGAPSLSPPLAAANSDLGWSLWMHEWRPRVSGVHAIQLRADDPSIRTRRLDGGYYIRFVEVERV